MPEIRSIHSLSTGDLRIRGQLPAGLSVGIVGARAASKACLEWTATLASELGRRGYAIISGGARGVDAAAHLGALGAGAATVAVLGTGLDVPYPPEHRPLFDRIVRAGGAVASPFHDRAGVARWRFPARNNVIAALSGALVVAEAGATSGSLHTVRAARALGRSVLAHPGSPGADRLLAMGLATVCDSADDVVLALGGTTRPLVAAPPDGEAAQVLAAFGRTPNARDLHLDLADVARGAGLDVGSAAAALTELELAGLILRDAAGRFSRSLVEVA